MSLCVVSHFQETVAMDLKYKIHFYIMVTLAHVYQPQHDINIMKDTILKAMFCIWIAVYGYQYKTLVEHG